MLTNIINVGREDYAANIENISDSHYKLLIKLEKNIYSSLINKIDIGLSFNEFQSLLNFVKGNPQNIIFALNGNKLFININIPFEERKLNLLLQEEEINCSCQYKEITKLNEEITRLNKEITQLNKKVARYEWRIYGFIVLISAIIYALDFIFIGFNFLNELLNKE